YIFSIATSTSDFPSLSLHDALPIWFIFIWTAVPIKAGATCSVLEYDTVIALSGFLIGKTIEHIKQHTASVLERDRTTTGADGVDVDHGDPCLIVTDFSEV